MEFLGQMSKQEIDDNKLIQLLTRVMRKTYSGMSGRSKAIKLLREQYKKHVAEGFSFFHFFFFLQKFYSILFFHFFFQKQKLKQTTNSNFNRRFSFR